MVDNDNYYLANNCKGDFSYTDSEIVMKCYRCGYENLENAKFCMECGENLLKDSGNKRPRKGLVLLCSDCNNSYFVGDSYLQGAKNYCWECLVKKADNISQQDYTNLGDTERTFLDGIQKMGGVSIFGASYWITFMKIKVGELPKDALKESLYSKKPEDFVLEFQRLLNGMRAGYFACLEMACELATSFKNESDQEAVDILIKGLEFDDPYFIKCVATTLGNIKCKRAIPALIAAFDEGGYFFYKNRPQMVKGRSVFGSYRDKIQGLCEALLMIGDSKGLEVAESGLRQLFADAKLLGVRASMDTEKTLLDKVTKARKGGNEASPAYEAKAFPLQTNTLATFTDQGTTKISDLKTNLKKATEDTYLKLLNKSKSLKNVIESGEYKKILDNEFIKKTLSWFRVSDERLRIPVYVIWCYFIFGIIFLSSGQLLMLFNPALIGSGLMMYGFSYLMRSSEKMRNFLSKAPGTGGEGLGSLIMTVLYLIPAIWWWMFCWPAEKLYTLFFYKYTNLSMGIGYLSNGEFDKALEELEKAMVSKKDKEGNEILFASLGETYSELGRYDEAINAYNQALQFSEDPISIKRDLAYCYLMKNQIDESLRLFREILNVEPQNINNYMGMGRCYLSLEMFDDAINYLKQGLSLEPQNATIHKMMAEVYLGLGDEEKALEEARLCQSLNPETNIADEAQNIIDYILRGPEEAEPIKEKDEPRDNSGLKIELIDPPINTSSDTNVQVMPKKPIEETVPLGELSYLNSGDLKKNFICSNPSCKKEVPGDSFFCGFCGTKLVRV